MRQQPRVDHIRWSHNTGKEEFNKVLQPLIPSVKLKLFPEHGGDVFYYSFYFYIQRVLAKGQQKYVKTNPSM